MAHKLWEKNFEVNKEIERFTVGRDRELDLYLAKYDVLGSMAHITMLESIGLLEKDELTQLLAELKNIYAIADKGDFVIEEGVEDVHSQVELMLTQKLGDMGKKIHSGRSRNDQVLVDLKLFTRHELKEIVDAVKILFDELIQKSNQYKDVLMPGYTHLQVAMPSSFGLWFGAYAESLADKYGFTVTYFEDSPTMYQAVVGGQVAACFDDTPIMASNIKDTGIGMEIIDGTGNDPAAYGFAIFNKDNQELIDMFNAGLANIKADGTYDEIIAKYLG